MIFNVTFAKKRNIACVINSILETIGRKLLVLCSILVPAFATFILFPMFNLWLHLEQTFVGITDSICEVVKTVGNSSDVTM